MDSMASPLMVSASINAVCFIESYRRSPPGPASEASKARKIVIIINKICQTKKHQQNPYYKQFALKTTHLDSEECLVKKFGDIDLKDSPRTAPNKS